MIRGLNVTKNRKTGFVVSDTGMGWRRTSKDLDGKTILINGDGKGNEHWERADVEHGGDADFDGNFGKDRYHDVTYKAIRAIETRTYNLYYSVWCNANLALAAASVSRCSLVCDERMPRSDFREASLSNVDIYSCRRIDFSPQLPARNPYFRDILRQWLRD